LFDAIVELQEKDALRIAKDKILSGEDPIAVAELCRKAISVVGDRFAKKEYFLSDLIMAGEIFKEIMEILEPQMQARARSQKKIGKVVIGTVKGDVHDIGKNIVVSVLKINGFDVYDLGVDVPPEKFVEKMREVKPEIVGMSCIMITAFESMKDAVNAIKGSGLRKKVKIIVGGGVVNEEVAQYVGADAYAKDVIQGVTLCKKWVKV
jgi:5-methyltetrahydrofolate--homocysteine methyltransferase